MKAARPSIENLPSFRRVEQCFNCVSRRRLWGSHSRGNVFGLPQLHKEAHLCYLVHTKIHSKGVCFLNGQNRKDIRPGLTVDIVLKVDQPTGKRTRGIVKEILTNSPSHPHGI